MTTIEASLLLGCSVKTIDRYRKKGLLNPKKEGKSYDYSKKELLSIAPEYVANRDNNIGKVNSNTEPPDRHTPPPPSEFEEVSKPEALLNEIGQGELLRVTKSLRDAELLDSTDPMLIMKYSLFQQLFIKYLHLSEKDPFYTKTMEIYQKHVSFYEKELGLTTAARLKMKPPKPEPEKDPFQEMMND